MPQKPDPIASTLNQLERLPTAKSIAASTRDTLGLLDEPDYIDGLLDGEIEKAQRPKQRAPSYDTFDLLESAATDVAAEQLGAHEGVPVTYAAQMQSREVVEAAIPEELLSMPAEDDGGVYIDMPADYERSSPVPLTPEQLQARHAAGVNAEFVWSRKKLLAAGMAVIGASVRKIAALVDEPEEVVAEWHRSRFFQMRVRAARDQGPRMAFEFLLGQGLLVSRQLMAIILSGTNENATQLRGIKLYYDVTGFKAENFLKDKDASPALVGVLNALEADVRVIDDDPSEENAVRDLGPELVAAVAEAGKALRQDDLKLLQRPSVFDADEAADGAVEALAAGKVDRPRSVAEILDDAIDALPDAEPPSRKTLDLWARADALDLADEDFLGAQGVIDPDADADLTTLLALRIDDAERDPLYADLLRKTLRGKRWQPIITLDPVIRDRIRAKRRNQQSKTTSRRQRSDSNSFDRAISGPRTLILAK